MLGSRVCWQLLLGWALLLGQPVFGDSDAAEEPAFAESEEPVPESQEPEEPVPELQEPEEPVPELQEPEEPVPVSEETEEPIPEAGESEELVPEAEEPEERELTSDEKLENYEREDREYLQEELSAPWSDRMDNVQRAALEHHHKHSEEFYKPFMNANIISQKAIGTTIHLRMTMVKTNCTNDRQPKEEESDASYYYRLYHADRYPRNCEPLADSKKQECRFKLFEDARNPGEPVVISYWCMPFFGGVSSLEGIFRDM